MNDDAMLLYSYRIIFIIYGSIQQQNEYGNVHEQTTKHNHISLYIQCHRLQLSYQCKRKIIICSQVLLPDRRT